MIRLLCYTLSFVSNNLGNCKKFYQSSFKKLLDRIIPDMVLVIKMNLWGPWIQITINFDSSKFLKSSCLQAQSHKQHLNKESVDYKVSHFNLQTLMSNSTTQVYLGKPRQYSGCQKLVRLLPPSLGEATERAGVPGCQEEWERERSKGRERKGGRGQCRAKQHGTVENVPWSRSLASPAVCWAGRQTSFPEGIRQEAQKRDEGNISTIFYPKLNLSPWLKKKNASGGPIEFPCPVFRCTPGVSSYPGFCQSPPVPYPSRFKVSNSVRAKQSRSERLLPERHVYLHQKHHPLRPSAAPLGPGTASWRQRSACAASTQPRQPHWPRGGVPSPGCLSAPRGQFPPQPLRKQLHSYE